MSEITNNPKIEIEMQNGDRIRAELYPEFAPKSVENFLKLIDSGYYDGLIFHRVIKGFMIQGGCPQGNGMGGPGWNIPGEFSQNGFDNPLKHTRGVLSMARAQDPNSAGSQFFIMTDDAPHLDGGYAAFGRVMDEQSLVAVDRIVDSKTPQSELAAGKNLDEITDKDGNRVNVNRSNLDRPIDPPTIKKIARIS